MRTPISLVQLGPIGDIASRAVAAERLGYHRYWFTEHYGNGRSGSPLIAASLAASATTTLRVGTAAVLVAHTTPLRLATDAALLSHQSGARFDLGIASGVAPLPAADDARRESSLSFEDAAEQLAAFVARTHPDTHLAGPATPPGELWICGEGRRSCRVAARLGAGLLHGPISAATAGIIDEYRSGFRSDGSSSPRVGLLMRGYCAGTDREAEQAWNEHGFAAAGIEPDFLGSPDRCAEAVVRQSSETGVDEIAVAHLAATTEQVDRSASLMAKACGLEATRGTSFGS